MRSRILLISSFPDDGRRLSEMLHMLRLVVVQVETLQQARAALRQDEYDLVLTEAVLLDGNWLDVLHVSRGTPHELKVVVTGPHLDDHSWSEALEMGAYDLLPQPFDEPEVRRTMSRACSTPLDGGPGLTGTPTDISPV